MAAYCWGQGVVLMVSLPGTGMHLARIIILIFGFFLVGTGMHHAAYGQNRAQLERQKRENERRLKQTGKILTEVQGKKEATLGQLTAVQEQIATRQARIKNIESEIAILDTELTAKTQRIELLQTDLTKLKKEYGAMVYAAGKATLQDKLFYVFAAQDFNQFFARINYLKQYSLSRRRQAAQIDSVRGRMQGERQKLQNKKVEKQALLKTYTAEQARLDNLKTEQTRLVRRLSDKEEKLRTELANRANANRKLERLIADMIRREMRKAEEERRRADARKAREGGTSPATTTPAESREAIPMSAENIKLSNSFAENKGRLGWPVEAGFIAGRFGRQAHPILKGVYVENLGVNIQTKTQEKVMAVFGGEVGFVADIPGVEGKIVSIMHGNYFTVYSNMRQVSVKPGQKVKTREIIGMVNTDDEGLSELQFQIWKGSDRMNPESWLQGR